MGIRESTDRTTLSELSRPFWILLAISFVGVLVLVGLLAVMLNRNALQSSEHVFEAAMANRLNQLSTLTQEYGYWEWLCENAPIGLESWRLLWRSG